MRIGINGSSLLARPSLEALADHAREADADGFHSYWLAQSGAIDALTAIAFAAPRAPRIEFGTAVVPSFPRHPSALATQALTTQAAIGGRLVLGIGLSHQAVIEQQFGLSFEKPVRHMKEYLSILRPILEQGKVAFRGETLSTKLEWALPETRPCEVLVAALGPQMLRLAGRLAGGTILWVVGARTIANHIAPTIREAAEAAGRPAPRIVAGLPVCVTDEAEAVHDLVARMLVIYGQLPSYRAMLDREGAEGPADVALIGDEARVREGLEAVAAAGATDFAAVEVGRNDEERARTRALLRSML